MLNCERDYERVREKERRIVLEKERETEREQERKRNIGGLERKKEIERK